MRFVRNEGPFIKVMQYYDKMLCNREINYDEHNKLIEKLCNHVLALRKLKLREKEPI